VHIGLAEIQRDHLMVEEYDMGSIAIRERLRRALPHIGALAATEIMWIGSQMVILALDQDGLVAHFAQVLVVLTGPAIGAFVVLRVREVPSPVRSPVVAPYTISFVGCRWPGDTHGPLESDISVRG
jgi:hypothetical protein